MNLKAVRVYNVGHKLPDVNLERMKKMTKPGQKEEMRDPVTVNADVSRCLEEIKAEYYRAKKKHPKWPIDLIHQINIVAEEMGEAERSANHCLWDNGDYKKLKEELIQTAAMCVRMLCNG